MKVCKKITDLKALLEKDKKTKRQKENKKNLFSCLSIKKLTNPCSATDAHYENVLQCIYR